MNTTHSLILPASLCSLYSLWKSSSSFTSPSFIILSTLLSSLVSKTSQSKISDSYELNLDKNIRHFQGRFWLFHLNISFLFNPFFAINFAKNPYCTVELGIWYHPVQEFMSSMCIHFTLHVAFFFGFFFLSFAKEHFSHH